MNLFLEKSKQKLEVSESALSQVREEITKQEQVFNDTQNKLLLAKTDIEKIKN
ncbi:hypothetical protein Q5M85_19255 [Paraclostridium bifermentans]|nr:hypothetical protein [Paraclostridium bifermentans]